MLAQAIGHREHHDVEVVLRQAQPEHRHRILIAPLPPAQLSDADATSCTVVGRGGAMMGKRTWCCDSGNPALQRDSYLSPPTTRFAS